MRRNTDALTKVALMEAGRKKATGSSSEKMDGCRGKRFGRPWSTELEGDSTGSR
jgi:hypothetical protein